MNDSVRKRPTYKPIQRKDDPNKEKKEFLNIKEKEDTIKSKLNNRIYNNRSSIANLSNTVSRDILKNRIVDKIHDNKPTITKNYNGNDSQRNTISNDSHKSYIHNTINKNYSNNLQKNASNNQKKSITPNNNDTQKNGLQTIVHNSNNNSRKNSPSRSYSDTSSVGLYDRKKFFTKNIHNQLDISANSIEKEYAINNPMLSSKNTTSYDTAKKFVNNGLSSGRYTVIEDINKVESADTSNQNDTNYCLIDSHGNYA